MPELEPGTAIQHKKQHSFNTGALIDLVVIMATLVIIKQAVLPYSFLYAGPASTFSAMLVGTFLLHRRGLSWKELGLRWPDSWLKILGLTVFTFFAFAIAADLMGWVADQYFAKVTTSGRFEHVQGNWKAYLIIMLLTWTHASFFEELLFRAFIINRASTFLGSGLKADLIAVVFSAVFFGYRHYYYQGINGALQSGAIGLTLGLLYIWYGRKNILPLVFAHGIMNSIGQSIRFLGLRA